jgi:hypothetical protein
MSNALERTGRRMDEALARLRQEQSARRPASYPPTPSSSASSFSAPVPADGILHYCVCAGFDRWFAERFERQLSGLYRSVETVRIPAGHGGSGSGASMSRVLNVREIEGRYSACPWCGENAGKRYYCYCGAPVCGGRVKGNLFICRDSCGERWEMGPPVREIRVTDAGQDARDYGRPERGPATWQAPVRSSSVERLLLPPARGRK